MTSDGRFSVLQGEMDGHPLIAIINMGLREYNEKATVPWFLSLSTPLIDPRSHGWPTTEDANNLNDWEDKVGKELNKGTIVIFVGRVTWNGHRELLYYVSDEASTTKRLRDLIHEGSTRAFAFRCERDDNWDSVRVWLNR